MISFISRFKTLLSSIACIIMIETLIFFFSPIRSRYNTNFLELAYRKQESLQKYIIFEKNREPLKMDSEFVMVGDSSGLHGVQPLIVENYLHGMKMANMSAATDSGFDGYRYLSRYYMDRNKKTKAVILYITPFSLPEHQGLNQALAQSIRKHYLTPVRILNSFPVMAIRLPVTNFLYYGKFDDTLFNFNTPFIIVDEEKTFKEWEWRLAKDKGWLPMNGSNHPPTGECDFRITHDNGKTFVEDTKMFWEQLEKFYQMTHQYNVTFSLIFNPVSCEVVSGVHSDSVQMQLDAFALRHPDVFIPFDLVSTFGSKNFVDRWHLNSQASVWNSKRIGKMLRKVVRGDQNISYYRNSLTNIKLVKDGLDGAVESYDENGHLNARRNYKAGKLDNVEVFRG